MRVDCIFRVKFKKIIIIKAFVDSNPTIKWCPFPGCGMAVRNPNLNTNQNTETDQHGDQNCKEFSSTVDCGSGHYFCW